MVTPERSQPRSEPERVVPRRTDHAPGGARQFRRGIHPRLQAVVRIRRTDQKRRDVGLHPDAAVAQPSLRAGVRSLAAGDSVRAPRHSRGRAALGLDQLHPRLRAATLGTARGLLGVYPPEPPRRPDQPSRDWRAGLDLSTGEDSLMDQQTFHPLDYMEAVNRRKWWFIVPLLLCIALGAAAVAVWPKKYLSRATI